MAGGAIHGSCLCGGVRYEIARVPSRMTHCHCSQCRKGHGAAFATYAQIASADLRFTSGGELIRRFRSSADVHRSFCGVCGSNLTFEWSETPHTLWIAAGAFDDDPGVRAGCHIYVDSKAPWYPIEGALPQYPEGLPDPA
jgi:hypothetical protein